jgi:hypothetical protein
MRHLMIAMLIVGASCGGSFTDQASKTLATTLTATAAASDQFVEWDKQHQLDIVDDSKTRAEAEERLASYRAKRQRVMKSFTVAFSAIASAAAIVPLVEDGTAGKSDLAKLLLDAASAVKTALDVFREMRGAFSDHGNVAHPAAIDAGVVDASPADAGVSP